MNRMLASTLPTPFQAELADDPLDPSVRDRLLSDSRRGYWDSCGLIRLGRIDGDLEHLRMRGEFTLRIDNSDEGPRPCIPYPRPPETRR